MHSHVHIGREVGDEKRHGAPRRQQWLLSLSFTAQTFDHSIC